MKNGDPIKLNFESLKTQKCITSTKKQKKKNGVIYPDITLTPAVMVIKMSKIAQFFYFLLMTAKKSITTIGLLGSRLPVGRYQPLKIPDFSVFCCLSSSFLFISS